MSAIEKALQSGIAPFVDRKVPSIESTSSIETTITSFRAAPSGSVLLYDSGTRALSGIITGSDFTKLRQDNPPAKAEDLATTEVVAIRDTAQLWQLLKIMNGENALNRPLDSLPVVDADSRPVGIVTRDCLMKRLAELDMRKG